MRVPTVRHCGLRRHVLNPDGTARLRGAESKAAAEHIHALRVRQLRRQRQRVGGNEGSVARALGF